RPAGRWRSLVHRRSRTGARRQPAQRAARTRHAGRGRPRARGGTRPRAPLAGAAAGRFRDDIVTPGRGAGCLESDPRRQSRRASHEVPMDIRTTAPPAPTRPAEIVREYGPFDGAEAVHGVSFDGRHDWAATGPRLLAIDPHTGETTRAIERNCDAGTAFDGSHLYQIAEKRIEKIDPANGTVLHSIPAPSEGCDSGLAWADGHLWVG